MFVDVPNPSQRVSHAQVEEIASECFRRYADRRHDDSAGVDPESFLDLCLGASIVWDVIEEPPDAVVFATYDEETGAGRVTINSTHRSFLESRPEILRSSLGHEAGHAVLRHYGELNAPRSSLALFDEPDELDEPRRLFHRSSWVHDSLSREDVAALRQIAAHNTTARKVLQRIDDTFEPVWMYRQAQHFSMSLLIPKARLDLLLEQSWDLSSWRGIYDLARRFRVSPSMMRTRLSKLGIIVIGPDGRPRPGDAVKQPRLL
jgi:hypothetical protein